MSIFLSCTWEGKGLSRSLLVSWNVPAALGVSLPAGFTPGALCCNIIKLFHLQLQTRMHSFLKYFLSTYHKSGSVLGPRDTAETNKQTERNKEQKDTKVCSHRAYITGEQERQWTSKEWSVWTSINWKKDGDSFWRWSALRREGVNGCIIE